MSAEPNPIILSFYQATLLPIVHDVNVKWGMKDYNGAFNSLKMMYSWLPNVCKKECKDEYNNALRTIEAIRNGFKELDISTRHAKIGIATREFLYSEVIKLSAAFHDSLDRNKYLEKAGVKPKFGKMGKL
jgi:alcohol dehydrogenase YqhD (iron-dependent ADH family)